MPTNLRPSTEKCPEYCATLRLPPRTTHIAFDLALAMDADGLGAKHSDGAITAACIYAASHLMDEADSTTVDDIIRVLGVKDGIEFWKAYACFWRHRNELVTGKIQCHGAKVERLPIPRLPTPQGKTCGMDI